MNIKKILALGICACTLSAAFADQPFRDHRYDSFKATPTEEGQIVFAGNSITNMHSWFEAFGSHQEVVGRGNSGGFAYELLANLESYIDAKPAKFFVMIGTNDISSGVSADLTARRIEAIARRVRLESPETEVYVQSILPRSSNAKPDYENCNTQVSAAIEAMADEKVHFVNLSEACAGVNGNSDWSRDGLHPRPLGYAAWCREIEDKVGYATVYPETVEAQSSCGLSGSEASRVEQFPFYPVSEGDVLFFGDEQVHGGEWHELLRSNKIKDRGLKWGWGGITLPNATQVVTSSLENQENKPAKIFLFYGIGGTNETNYRLLVDEAKAQAPDAQIYIVSLTPSTNSSTDADRVSFNTVLQTIAEEKEATYVDIYTPLNADLSSNIMETNYISGRGYIVMANTLAQYLTEEGVDPVSLEEYDAVYASRTTRSIIGDAMTDALILQYGDQPGLIKEEYRDAILAAVADAASIVNNPDLTTAQATEKAQAISAVVATAQNDLNYPTASTIDAPVWYTLTSARGSYALTVEDGMLAGGTSGVTSLGYDVWQFIDRGDDTYDIRNANGQYINPTATHNTQMSVMTTTPDRGFSLSYSEYTTGSFVIYTDNSQLNQTSKTGVPVYNWYNTSLPNRSDQGCCYSLAEYDGTIIDPEMAPVQSGWYEITHASTGKVLSNMADVFKDVNVPTNSYSLQYVTTETTTPQNWVYIDIDDSGNRTVQLLNGFYLSEYQTDSRTAVTQTMTYSSTVAGAYDVNYWVPFSRGGSNPVDVLGRSSSSVTPHYFRHVQDSEIAEYDVWTVTIAANLGSQAYYDTHVTLNSDAHHGIATVYNNGTYFLTPGTTFTADDLTIVAPEGVEQDKETPLVIIDATTKEIKIIYSDVIEVEVDTPLATGWYTMKLISTQSSETNRASLVSNCNTGIASGINTAFAADTEYHQAINNGHYYYHVGVANADDIESPALTYFYVEHPALATINIKSQNGHYILANGTATRSITNITVSSLTNKNNIELPLCLFLSNSLGCPHDLIGSFSGVTSTWNVTAVDPVDYDLYTVNIIGETAADAIVDDVQITLATAANKGLQSVYNGGTFFVEKGTSVAVSDITAPAHGDVAAPTVTVADNVITVDYTRVETEIVEVNAAEEAQPAEIYDLWGRRARTPRHGFYIVNGQKVRL